MTSLPAAHDARLTYRVDEASKVSGLSRSTIFEHIRTGRVGSGAAMKRALLFRRRVCLSAGAGPFVSPKAISSFWSKPPGAWSGEHDRAPAPPESPIARVSPRRDGFYSGRRFVGSPRFSCHRISRAPLSRQSPAMQQLLSQSHFNLAPISRRSAVRSRAIMMGRPLLYLAPV
jgi:hypothetical protein